MPAAGGWPGRVRRGSAGPGVGFGSGPVHHSGEYHHQAAAAQAGRPAGHPHRPRGRVPGGGALTVRLRFALLYSGAFLLTGLLVLSVAFLTVSSTQQVGSAAPVVVRPPVAPAFGP